LAAQHRRSWGNTEQGRIVVADDYPGAFSIPANQYSPPDTRASQLYMAALTRNRETGEIKTYSSAYLWNQTPNTSNLTPAWDEFLIPPAPPRLQ
jgi:hypothetical protein